MEQKCKDVIRRNYMPLAKDICNSVEDLVKHLFMEGIISRHMEEDILCQPKPTSKAYKLLDILPTRGSSAYKVFYEGLLEHELWNSADIIEPNHKPHKAAPRSASLNGVSNQVVEPLPEKWPSQERAEKVGNLLLNVKTVEPDTGMFQVFNNMSKESEFYEMNKLVRGHALIIDNGLFEHLTPRQGTDLDSKALNKVLHDLGFQVIVERNKTKEDMNTILQREFDFDHSEYNCFILVILSHGVKGKVFGTNGVGRCGPGNIDNFIEVAEIRKKICDIETLKNKPKLIFIQACQNDPNSQQESSSANANSSAQFMSGIRFKTDDPDCAVQDDVTDSRFSKSDSMKEDVYSENFPKASDFLLATATIEGSPSFRNSKFGSWFIQALAYCLEYYAFNEELTHILQKVTQLVKKARTEKDLSQVCEMTSTLSKKLYFFPGLPIQDAPRE